MIGLRNAAYLIVFFTVSVPFVLLAPLVRLFGRGAIRWYAARWTDFQHWATRTLLGLRSRIEGALPTGPVLYAVKHQALYEALELPVVLGHPAVVMKRELARIPIWGWASQGYGTIVVDREGSAVALRRMMREAKTHLAAGRSILIFPEGTRTLPGEAPPLQPGFAGLYRMLKLPVVPIAVDSGRFWPKHGAKRSGEVTFRLGEPIPPGLAREVVEERVFAAINALN